MDWFGLKAGQGTGQTVSWKSSLMCETYLRQNHLRREAARAPIPRTDNPEGDGMLS